MHRTDSRRAPGPVRPGPALVATLALLLSAAPLAAEPISAFRDKPDEWFTSDEAKQILSNVLTWQNPNGGWWKQYDATKPYAGEARTPETPSTFDNNATWTELRLLARAYTLTQRQEYLDAFDRGFAMVLAAQYPNGGWPQQYPPPPDKYNRHITYNDGAMVGVMNLLWDIAPMGPPFPFLNLDTRLKAAAALDKGVECILASQIKVKGELTVWCAQHDAKTLAPAKARTYELPSLSGGESADILLMLMRDEDPDERVKRAVQAGVKWYEKSKLTGIRLQKVEVPGSPRGDVVVVEDPSAEPLWARFYDLETGKPFFCGRDGVKKDSMAEIEAERRGGYAWLRPWGKKVLEAYPKWAEKHGIETTAAVR